MEKSKLFSTSFIFFISQHVAVCPKTFSNSIDR